jgi:hypothetical protein
MTQRVCSICAIAAPSMVSGVAPVQASWDHGRDTAPDRGRRNAGIDFCRRTNHSLAPRQLIAKIGAAGRFSLRGHGQASTRDLVRWKRTAVDRPGAERLNGGRTGCGAAMVRQSGPSWPRAVQTRTGLYRHSNRSLFASGNSCREKVWPGRRPRWHFKRHPPIPGDRDRAILRLRRQSRGKSKTIPTAPGNRLCAGLRGGAGRTQTNNQPVMAPEGDRINGRRLTIAQKIGWQECRPIDTAPPAQAPSRWCRAVPCRR